MNKTKESISYLNLRNELRSYPKIRNLLQKAYWGLYRRNFFVLTAPFRVLPDFIIIGAMKCGTTSLYYDICEHPCVSPAAYDEIGFFDSNYELGINWYKSLFPTVIHKELVKIRQKHFVTGEDTPFYFWNPKAARRIFKLLPNIKLIVILRNPIDRAYSEYQDLAKDDPNFPSFNECIENEIKIRGKETSIEITEENFEIFNQEKSYLLKGIYVDQLRIWINLFSKDQILILSTEQLNSEPISTLEAVFHFLNLPNYKIKNPQKRKAKKYASMYPETRNTLIDFFRPHNQQLFKFIGKEFDWDR